MGNAALIVQIVGVLLILFFCFLVYMCTKTWRVWHVLFLFCTFAAATTFLAFQSMSLKTHKAWRELLNETEAALVEEQETLESLEKGSPDKMSVAQARTALQNVVMDRGRTWRNCQLINPQGDSITLVTGQAGVDGAAPAPNRIEPKTLLYVFLEREVDPLVGPVPVGYLGEFAATQTTDTSVTMQRTIPALPSQNAMLQQGVNATWSLYELLPVDGHEWWFADLDEATRDDKQLRREEITKVMPKPPQMSNEAYEAMIMPYIRDGLEATDADPPENHWVRVKFKRNHVVDVDSQAPPTLDSRYFDEEGRAEIARLKMGEPVEFEIGDVVILDNTTAKDWIGQGICAEEGPIVDVYMRSLYDYEYLFREIYNRIVLLNEAEQLVARNQATLNVTVTTTESDIAYRAAEKEKLEADLAGFREELNAISRYASALEAKLSEVKERARVYFAKNNQMEAYLDEMTKKLTDEIDARTRAATAPPST